MIATRMFMLAASSCYQLQYLIVGKYGTRYTITILIPQGATAEEGARILRNAADDIELRAKAIESAEAPTLYVGPV